jgi:hypothetical protein
MYLLHGNITGKQKWFMSSDDFESDTIMNVEGRLAEADQQLCVKDSTSMSDRYRAGGGYNLIDVSSSGKILPEYIWSYTLGSGTWLDWFTCAGCNVIK